MAGEQRPGQAPYGEQQAQPQQGNGVAIAAMVLGILGLIMWWIPGLGLIVALLGLIFGIVGMKKAGRIGGKGKGLAITGLITGILGLIPGTIWTCLAIFVTAVGISGAENVANRLKTSVEIESMATAIRDYHITNKSYPDSLDSFDTFESLGGTATGKLHKTDPWGNNYVYKKTATGFEFMSEGPSTDTSDDDIYWDFAQEAVVDKSDNLFE